MTVDVNLGDGTATMRMNETDPDASFFNQVEAANDYMAEQVSAPSFHSGRYDPFKKDAKQKDGKEVLDCLKDFTFQPCDLQDDKSKKLYSDLNPDKNWLKKSKGKLGGKVDQTGGETQPKKLQSDF